MPTALPSCDSDAFNALPPDEQELARSFAQLKRTARSAENIEAWLKQHPVLVPGLPREHASLLEVDLQVEALDWWPKSKTAVEYWIATFTIASVDEAPGCTLFHQVTQMKLVKNHASADYFFRSAYELCLNALEWRFVAANLTAMLDDADLMDDGTVLIMENIVNTQFPELGWTNYLSLRAAGLLPPEQRDIAAFLMDYGVNNNEKTSSAALPDALSL